MKKQFAILNTSILLILFVVVSHLNSKGVVYYWVGGSGNWSGAGVSHWSSSSGGGTLTVTPGQNDDVIFDNQSASGDYTVTIDAVSNCRNWTMIGSTLSGTRRIAISGVATLNIYGGILFDPYESTTATAKGINTLSWTGTLNFKGTGNISTGTNTTYTSNVRFNNNPIIFDNGSNYVFPVNSKFKTSTSTTTEIRVGNPVNRDFIDITASDFALVSSAQTATVTFNDTVLITGKLNILKGDVTLNKQYRNEGTASSIVNQALTSGSGPVSGIQLFFGSCSVNADSRIPMVALRRSGTFTFAPGTTQTILNGLYTLYLLFASTAPSTYMPTTPPFAYTKPVLTFSNTTLNVSIINNPSGSKFIWYLYKDGLQTVNASGSTINFSAPENQSNIQCSFGGYTYNTVTFDAPKSTLIRCLSASSNKNVYGGGTFNTLDIKANFGFCAESFIAACNAATNKWNINTLLKFHPGYAYTAIGFNALYPLSGYEINLLPGAVHSALGTCQDPIIIQDLNALRYDTPSQLVGDYCNYNSVRALNLSACTNNTLTSVNYGINSVFTNTCVGYVLAPKPATRTLYWVGPATPSTPRTCTNLNDTSTYGEYIDANNWSNNPTASPSNRIGMPQCPPTYVDSIVFPNGSYVKTYALSIDCKSMLWQGLGELYSRTSSIFNVWGSLEFSPQTKNAWTGDFLFKSYEPYCYLQTQNKPFLGGITFNSSKKSTVAGVDNFLGAKTGKWLIIDTLKSSGAAIGGISMQVISGHLYTRDQWNLYPASKWIAGAKSDGCIIARDLNLIGDSVSLFASKIYIKQGGRQVSRGSVYPLNVNTNTILILNTGTSEIIFLNSQLQNIAFTTCNPVPLSYNRDIGNLANFYIPGNTNQTLEFANLGKGQQYHKIRFACTSLNGYAELCMKNNTIAELTLNANGLIHNNTTPELNSVSTVGNTAADSYFGYIRKMICNNSNATVTFMDGGALAVNPNLSIDTLINKGHGVVQRYQGSNLNIRVNKLLKYYPGKTHTIDATCTFSLTNANVLNAVASCDSAIVIQGLSGTLAGTYLAVGTQTSSLNQNIVINDVVASPSLAIQVVGASSSQNGTASGWDLAAGSPRLLRWQDNTVGASAGNWLEGAHWQKAVSGNLANKPAIVWGPLGECTPTQKDTVYFDNTSFGNGDTLNIKLGNGIARCATFYWGVTSLSGSNAPTVKGNGDLFYNNPYDALHIYDSLIFNNKNNINWQFNGDVVFRGNARNAVLKLAGVPFKRRIIFRADNPNHIWRMQGSAADSLVCNLYGAISNYANGRGSSVPAYLSADVEFEQGTLYTKDKTLNIGLFRMQPTNLKQQLYLGSSRVNMINSRFLNSYGSPPVNLYDGAAAHWCIGGRSASIQSTANLFIKADSATIVIHTTGTGNYQSFTGGGFKYGKVVFSGTALEAHITGQFSGGVGINRPDTIGEVSVSNAITNFFIGKDFGTGSNPSHNSSSAAYLNANSRFRKVVFNNTSSNAVTFIVHASNCYFDTLIANGGASFYEDNFFNNWLKISPAKSYVLGANKTQWLSNRCEFKPIGTSGNVINLSSSISGNEGRIRKDSGIVCGDYIYMQDIWCNGNGLSTQTSCSAFSCDTVLGSSYDGVNSAFSFSCGIGYSSADLATSGRARFQAGPYASSPASNPNVKGWEYCGYPFAPKVDLTSMSPIICEGDSVRIQFRLEGTPPYQNLTYIANTNSGAGYPVGSNVAVTIPGNLMAGGSIPSYSVSPGLKSGDILAPQTPSLSPSTFGSPTNPYLYSYWIKPSQNTRYILGSVSVDRCFNSLSTTGTGTLLITVNPAPSLLVTTLSPSSLCSGSSAVTFTSSATLGNTYTLYPALTGTLGGIAMTSYTAGAAVNAFTAISANTFTAGTTPVNYTYYLQAQSNLGCNSFPRVPVTVTVNPLPTIALATQTNISCFGSSNAIASVTISNGTPNYTYSWSPGVSSTTNSASGLSAGNYTVASSDSKGCSVTQTFVITQPTSSLSITSSNSFSIACYGIATGSAQINVTGGTTGYTYSWTPSVTSTTNSAIGLSVGNYTAMVTDANNCIAIQSFTISQPLSALSISSSNSSSIACNGTSTGSASIVTTGGIPNYTYSWSPSVGSTTNTATNLSAGNYTVTVKDANNCSINKNFIINQPTSALSISSVNSNSLTCFGTSTGSATVNATGGTPNYTYSWSPSSLSTTNTATGLIAGNYTATVKDANNCMSSQTIVIASPASALSISITGTTQAGCGLNNGSATTPSSGGTPGYTYSWTPPSPASSYTTNTATTNSLGAGITQLVVIDANGCSTQTTIIITNPNPPVINSTVTDVKCYSQLTGVITTTVVSGMSPYLYAWNNSATTASLTNVAAGVYTLTVTDASNCKSSQVMTVNQPSTAIAINAVTTSSVACFGAASGSITIAVSGGVPSYIYSWGSGVASTTTIATGLSANTYSAIITDAIGCVASQTFAIAQPTSAINIASSTQTNVLCNGQSNGIANVTATGGIPAYTYSWSPNVLSTTNIASGLSMGNYTVTVTDFNGCKINQPFIITQPNILSVAIVSTTQTGCGSNTGSAITLVTGGTASYTYSWTTASPGNSYTTTAATTNSLSAGINQLTVRDAHGCTTYTSALISNPNAPIITASTSSVSCFGDVTGAISTTVTSAIPGYSYTWNTGAITANLNNVPAGIYTVTVVDGGNCSAIQTATINQPASALNITIGTIKHVNCFGQSTGSVNATANGGTPIYSYVWQPSNTLSANLIDVPSGNYTITATDFNGCNTFSVVSINSLSSSSVNVMVNSIELGSCNQSNGIISVNATGGGDSSYTYQWKPINATGATISNLAGGNYSVTVTDNYGCIDTLSVKLDCKMDVYVPQLFTPNGDGKNDKLEITSIQYYPNNTVTIFNRWGSLVYSKHKYINDWDGKASTGDLTTGKELLPAGTYYIIVDFGDDKTKIYNGFVQLQY